MTRAVAPALAAALGLAACGFGATEAPVCDATMPAAATVLADPAFEPLEYYTRVNYEVGRGAGYDIWADSKFEYRAALQYSLVPRPGGTPQGAQFCARAVALRLALPLDEPRRRMLDAFVGRAAGTAGLDREQLAARLRAMLAGEERYRPLLRQGAVSVEAGRLSAPNRGEFFVVGFDGSSP